MERRQSMECGLHNDTREKLSSLEVATRVLEKAEQGRDEKIDTLFEKADETTRILGEIQLCIKGMSKDIKNGFESQGRQISELKHAFDSRVEYSDAKVAHYENVVQDFYRRFDDLSWINESVIVKWIVGVSLIILTALAAVHTVDLMRLRELIK